MNDQSNEKLPLRDRQITEISETLQAVLGQQLVAYAIGECDPKVIGNFARDEAQPSEDVEATLRDLAEVTETLLFHEQGSAPIVRAVMVGMNPTLGDESVIGLFHEGQAQRVLAVADQLGPE
jgi:hypothetical protein